MSGITVRKNFAAVERQMRQASEAAVQEAAEHLLEESNRTVPIEESTLLKSGEASSEGLTAQVSYGGAASAYAVVQHERTKFRHDAGRRSKWLQLTFQERASQVQQWLAMSIRRRIR